VLVDVAAYRIVQEALTNTMRHAPGSHARVEVREKDGALEISVTDTGGRPGPGPNGGGRGIIGMRERAALVAGTVTAGPGESGFRVHAVLPRLDPTNELRALP
jgi:signal transduction histidine kinase